MAMQSRKRKNFIIDENDYLLNKINKSHNMLQDFINYLSVPPLESMAIVNIAIAISKQSDIRDAIMEHSIKFDTPGDRSRGTFFVNSLNEINKNLFQKVYLLPLPSLLKAEVSNAITPVVKQILDGLSYNRKYTEHFESIYWTNEGIIDRVKTLENLIPRDSGESINDIFKKACEYCLETSIPQLWKKLPEAMQQAFLSTWAYKKYDRHIFAYWTCIVNDQLSVLMRKLKAFDNNDVYNCKHSVYKNMFTLAVTTGNSIAVNYFWKKLTFEEINSNLAQWLYISVGRIENYANNISFKYTNPFAGILFFLLTKLNDTELQREIYQKHSKVILLSLFNNWPWRRFLLPTIQVMWDFLDKNVYVQLLSSIIPHIRKGQTTEKLFRKLWWDSPIDLKKCFVQYIVNEDYYGTDVICNLLTMEDMGTIKEILSYVHVEQKKPIFFSVIENRNFNAMYLDKLPLFIVLVEDNFSSDSDIKDLKERIVLKNGNDLCLDWILADNWQMVEKFLNWTFYSQDQIDNFKNEIIDRNQITHRLLKQGNYGLVNRFLYWCCGSEQNINQFKKDFVASGCNYREIVELGRDDWCSFENFLSWCFSSEQEINEFKEDLLEFRGLQNIISDCIEYEYEFQFVDKLITWCCHSNEKIKQYKEKFVLSGSWLSILQRFVTNYKVYDAECNNWELIKKLVKLFPLFDEKLKVELKAKIEEEIDFEDFYWDFREISFRIEMKHLFRLLDDHEYSISDSNSSDDCRSDDVYSDSDDHCDISNNYDEDASVVLKEMINKVESDEFIKATK